MRADRLDNREQISVPLPRATREAIRRAAEADHRSVANLVRCWIECGLAEYGEQGGERAA